MRPTKWKSLLTVIVAVGCERETMRAPTTKCFGVPAVPGSRPKVMWAHRAAMMTRLQQDKVCDIRLHRLGRPFVSRWRCSPTEYASASQDVNSASMSRGEVIRKL